MAQEKPNPLVEWLLLIRRQIPLMRQYLDKWLAAVREEPNLIWQTPAIRWTVYGVATVLVLVVVAKIPGFVAPPVPAAARPEATTADFHVVCADVACGHHFVIHRKFGYGKFPVRCPKCEQQTGSRARRCTSKECHGRWVVPMEDEDRILCSRCGALIE